MQRMQLYETSDFYVKPHVVEVPVKPREATNAPYVRIESPMEGFAAAAKLERLNAIQEDNVVVVDEDQEEALARYRANNMGMDLFNQQQHQQQQPLKQEEEVRAPPGHCLVCNAATSGFHFGAVSCAACSAFFRRTIAEKRKYVCRKEGDAHNNCPINQEQRCYCRSCRLAKCLRVGMDPNAVQPHRDVIGSKKKPLPQPANEENLADHLIRNKRGQTVIRMEQQKDTMSPTAHLLTSTSMFAEHLLAFSRQPVISSREGSQGPRDVEGYPADPSDTPQKETARFVGGRYVRTRSHQPRIIDQNQVILYEYEEELNEDNGALDEAALMGDVPACGGYEEVVHATEEYVTAKETRRGGQMPSTLRQALDGLGEASTSSNNSSSAHISTITQSTNLIEQLVDAYRKLQERRRLIYCPSTIRDILGGTQPQPRPCKFYERNTRERMRVEIGLVVEFVNAIHPFAKIKLDDKVALFKHLSISFSILEKHFLTMLGGGLQTQRIIHSDGSYTDLTSPSFEVIDAPDNEKMDPETLNKLFIAPLKESLLEITGAMFHFGMTDVEFCALIAILLFDAAAPNLTEFSRRVVKEARDRVYHDWFAYYALRGIPDASQKVGNTLLLLPAVQTTVEKTQENFHLIRVFDLFEYDKILDEVFGN